MYLRTLVSILLFVSVPSLAEDSICQKSVQWMKVDTLKRPTFWQKIGNGIKSFVRCFDDIDTLYVEPQHYNYTAMVQNTSSYEVYRLGAKDRQSITFAPKWSYRIGPYLGWRWVFLGYTFDIGHLDPGLGDKHRQEYDLSLYSSMLGIDLYYRLTGSDYRILHMSMASDVDTKALEGVSFDGVYSSVKGFNLYYIFNHRKFSYPAAFSQSTVQRRSAGSVLAGIGYTRHKLSVDWEKLSEVIQQHLGDQNSTVDSTLRFGTVKYTDLSFSGGYAYNWVFARNWLLAVSLSAALAYKHNSGDVNHQRFSFRNFSLSRFNVDGIGRFGLVYNNSKWYVGASAILHTYNYHSSQLSTNNMFGNVNVYVGFNFGRRKHP